jgi:hypothetical protein
MFLFSSKPVSPKQAKGVAYFSVETSRCRQRFFILVFDGRKPKLIRIFANWISNIPASVPISAFICALRHCLVLKLVLTLPVPYVNILGMSV